MKVVGKKKEVGKIKKIKRGNVRKKDMQKEGGGKMQKKKNPKVN